MGAMPRRYVEPATCLTASGTYPAGPFQASTPAYVRVTALIVVAVNTATAERGWSNRRLAREAGIDPGALSRLLTGHTIPDVGTVVALESALRTHLYPAQRPLVADA